MTPRLNGRKRPTAPVGRTRRAVFAAAGLAAVALVAAVLWLRAVPRAVTSVTGEPLGHLPAGVGTADLNLLLVTLGLA